MALSTSFSGGWFYLGQFFDHAVGGWDDEATRELAKRDRQRTDRDIERSRCRFQVLVSAEDIIAELAGQLVEEDSEQAVLKALREAIEAQNIDWDPAYLQQFLDVRERLPSRQAYLEEKAAEAQRAWLERRQRKLRTLH